MLEDMLDVGFGFVLSLKHYFVIGYVLLINSVLRASLLPCSLFSDASTAFSC